MKLENLIAQKAEVVTEMRAILDRADAEGDRDVTPVEESAYNTLQTRLEKVEKAIEREKMLSEKEAFHWPPISTVAGWGVRRDSPDPATGGF